MRPVGSALVRTSGGLPGPQPGLGAFPIGETGQGKLHQTDPASKEMAKRLAATFVTLIYEATLKSFWRRAALSRFLRQAGIAESFVAAWSAHESKRQFLDRLFAKLADHPQGQDRLTAMARDLAEQTVFPDLQGWEDSSQKLRDARLAVEALKGAVGKLENQVQSDRDREVSQRRIRELQAESKRSRATLESLAQRMADLARQMGSQEAGYGFQTWFYDLMDFYEVVNRRPYSATGRQIDGSITVSGTTYLVELKFTLDQAAAPDVDSSWRRSTTRRTTRWVSCCRCPASPVRPCLRPLGVVRHSFSWTTVMCTRACQAVSRSTKSWTESDAMPLRRGRHFLPRRRRLVGSMAAWLARAADGGLD